MANFKQLEALFWLRQLGSFQRVADRINVTQPAVSARIAALEDMLGVQLVERNSGGIRLTRLGQEVAEHAEQVILMRDAMLDSVRRDTKTKLRIATVGPVAMTWGADLKRRIADRMPGITAEFTVGSNEQIFRDVKVGAVDLAFVSQLPGEHSDGPGLAVDYDVGWVGATDLVTALPRPITLRALGAQDLILYPPTSPLYSPVQSLLARPNVGHGVRHFANALPTIVEMLRGGYGFSAIPLAVVAADIAAGRLARFATDQDFAPLRIVCAHVSRHRRPLAEDVLALAREVVAGMAATSDTMRLVLP